MDWPFQQYILQVNLLYGTMVGNCVCPSSQGRPVHVKNYYGQNSGKQKYKLNEKVYCTKIGRIYKFCRNRGNFINFVETGGI